MPQPDAAPIRGHSFWADAEVSRDLPVGFAFGCSLNDLALSGRSVPVKQAGKTVRHELNFGPVSWLP